MRTKISLLLASIAVVPPTLGTAAATVVFISDFEDGNYNEWRAGEINTPWALKIVQGFSSNTSKVTRFEYRNTDVNSPYNTVKADLAGSHVGGMNTVQYASFDLNASAVRAVSKKSPTVFQYHAGKSGFPPFVSIAVNEEDGRQYLRAGVNYYPGGNSKNRQRVEENMIPLPSGWVHVVVYANFRSDYSGQFKIFINGSEEFRFNGLTGTPDASPYPRIGLYQANDDKVTSNFAPVNVVYFDNFKMGPTLASVQ